MRSRNAGTPIEKRVQFRIGIHVGDIIIDGDDIYGDGVNIAARLEGISEPGGICISSAVRDEVVAKVDIKFTDGGDQLLKNIARPVRIYRVELDGASPEPAPRDSPLLKTRTLRNLSIIGGAVVAALVLLLALGIPANFLVASLQTRVEAATGYRLRIDGPTSISVLPRLAVSVRQVTLLDHNGSDLQTQFKADSIRIALSLAGLLGGNPRITQITLVRPTMRLPLARERTSLSAAPAAAGIGSQTSATPVIDHIIIQDGSLGFYSGQSHLESSIEDIDLDITLGVVDEKPRVVGTFIWGSQAIHVDLKSQTRPQQLAGQTIPVDIALQIPGLSEQPLTATAQLKVRGASLAINTLSGRLGQSSFNGWATVDFGATKPLVQGDIDFDRLRIALASKTGKPRNVLIEPWSEKQFSVDALNFIDSQVRISAAELSLDTFAFAPIAVEADLTGGIVETKFAQAGLYGGQASGTMSLDASGPVPAHAAHVRLEGVDALPLLSNVAGFEHLEGKMLANIDVHGRGASEQAVISSLSGTIDFQLSNGAIRGIDVTKLMHDVATNILYGWQQSAADKTELAELNARFRVSSGVATVDNLDLAGPLVRVKGAGNIDLAAKVLQLRVEPRLTAGPVGLGVPIIIQGSWSEPRFYPDVAGILDNPDGAYAQMKAAGKGLFGGKMDASGQDKPPLNSVLEGIGKILTPPAGNTQAVPGKEP